MVDEHIPYYEAERHRSRFLDNPPAVVLVIQPQDRVIKSPAVWTQGRKTQGLRNWEEYLPDSQLMEYDAVPLFLENDARQEWYWAFWDANQALIAVMKL